MLGAVTSPTVNTVMLDLVASLVPNGYMDAGLVSLSISHVEDSTANTCHLAAECPALFLFNRMSWHCSK